MAARCTACSEHRPKLLASLALLSPLPLPPSLAVNLNRPLPLCPHTL